MIGAGMLVRSISYKNSPVPKHLAWVLHAGKIDVFVIEFPDWNSRHLCKELEKTTITLMFETRVVNVVFFHKV